MSENEGALYCAKCLLRYDQKVHVPKYLPCGHTLCLGCVRDLYTTDSKHYPCSSCKLTCPWSRNPMRSLATNQVVLRLLEVSQRHHQSSGHHILTVKSSDQTSPAKQDAEEGRTSSKDSGVKTFIDPPQSAKILHEHESKTLCRPVNSYSPQPRSLPPRPLPRSSLSRSSASEGKLSPRNKSSPRSPQSQQNISKSSHESSSAENFMSTKKSNHSLDLGGSRSSLKTASKPSKERRVSFEKNINTAGRSSRPRANSQHQYQNASSGAETPNTVQETLLNSEYLDMTKHQNVSSELLASNLRSEDGESPAVSSNSDYLVSDSGYLHINQSASTDSSVFPHGERKDVNMHEDSNPDCSMSGYLDKELPTPKLRSSALKTQRAKIHKSGYFDTDIKRPERWNRVFCERHYGKDCERLCLTCSRAVCPECLTSGTRHEEHHTVALGESLQQIPDIIKDHLDQFTEAKNEYLSSQKEARDSFGSWSKNLTTVVNERVTDLINKALQWRSKLECEIENIFEKMEKDMAQYDKFAEDRENQVRQCVALLSDITIVGSKHLEQLANIKKLKRQMKKLKVKVAQHNFQNVTLTSEKSLVDLGKLQLNGQQNPLEDTVPPTPKGEATKEDCANRSLTLPIVDTTSKEDASHLEDIAKQMPQLSSLSTPEVELASEVTIGETTIEEHHVDVNPFNDIISVDANAREITKYSYHNKQYERKWKKEMLPSITCQNDTFKIGSGHNIVICANNQTILLTPEFKLQAVYKGQYGVLMSTHETGHIYAAPMLHTGKYKVNLVSMDHQHVSELCKVSSFPKLASNPPNFAVLDVNEAHLRLLELKTGNLVHYVTLKYPEDMEEVCDIALSGWRLFVLDNENAILVYDIKANKLLTTLTYHELGLVKDFVIKRIWCSCVGLLHVLYVDWDSYKLRCYQLNKHNAIWPQ